MDIDRGTDRTSKSPRLSPVMEPIGEILARRLRVTVALTAIPTLIGSIMLSIFTGFGRPDVGAIVVGVLLLPVVVAAWVEYVVFRFRVRSYLKGSPAGENNDAPPK